MDMTTTTTPRPMLTQEQRAMLRQDSIERRAAHDALAAAAAFPTAGATVPGTTWTDGTTAEPAVITSSQARQLRELIRRGVTWWRGHSRPEVKLATVQSMGGRGHLVVRLEIGSVGDEGTLAEVFGREYFALYLGRRGGVSAVVKAGRVVRGRAAWNAQPERR